MQLLQLKYFCTAARHENMTRAARELWISQPSLSKTISRLEAELGMSLFERSGNNIRLSEAGRVFYENIVAGLAVIDDAVKKAKDVSDDGDRNIKVLAAAANLVIPSLLASFQAENPEIKLFVNNNLHPAAEDIAKYDFYLFALPEGVEDGDSIELAGEELVLAVHKEHPLAGKQSVTLAETAPYPYQTAAADSNVTANLLHFAAQAGFEPYIAFTSEDDRLFLAMAQLHHYLTLFPARSFDLVFDDSMNRVAISEPRCRRTLRLARNKNRYLSSAAALFEDYCRLHFAHYAE
ncbi:MAG: LysR family transcriptional regulator [Bacillota bacterium]|nr:LysR family transcriptional regulator [Bacillota bacterium]